MPTYVMDISVAEERSMLDCADLAGESPEEFILNAVLARVGRRGTIEVDIDDHVHELLDRGSERGETTDEFASKVIRNYLKAKGVSRTEAKVEA